MKKIICLVLSILMVVFMSMTAFGAKSISDAYPTDGNVKISNIVEVKSDGTYVVHEMGAGKDITLTLKPLAEDKSSYKVDGWAEVVYVDGKASYIQQVDYSRFR